MYCTNCGNKLKEDEKYCTKCGQKTENEKEELQSKNNDTPLILGILSCVLFTFPFVSVPLAIISIITGIKQKKESNKSSASIILGIISLVLTAIIIFLMILFVNFAVNHIKEPTQNTLNNIIDEIPFNEIIEDFDMDDIIDEYSEFYNNKNNTSITGYSWLGDDNSTLYLNSNNTYIWYEQDENHNDNYYQGTLKNYTGEDAIDYIETFLKEFKITEEEQKRLFEEDNINPKDYNLLILTCEKSKINGEESNGTNNIAYYYGIYSETEKRLELINLKTKTKAGFTMKEKLKNIDV